MNENIKNFLNELNQNELKEDKNEFDIIDKEFIKGFWEIIFTKASEKFNDERIKLNKEESEFLTNTTVKWLNYRLPMWISKNSVDFEFVFAILTVITSKYLIIRGKFNNNDTGTKRTGQNEFNKENIKEFK